MTSTLFLRRVLALDAASCAAMGVLLTLAAGPLAPLFGLPAYFIFRAGLVLLPIAAFIGWLASRAAPPPSLVWLVIAGNCLWVIESVLLIGQAGSTVTPIGAAFVWGQVLVVLVLSGLEYKSLRLSRTRAVA